MPDGNMETLSAGAGAFKDTMQGMGMLLGAPASSTSGTVSLTGAAQGSLDELLAALTGKLKGGKYSKEAAIEDTEGATGDLIQSLLQQYMPEISGAEKTAGSYNNTTAHMLRGDASARVTSAAHKSVLDSILGYAQVEQGIGQQIVGAAGATGRTTSSETPGTGGVLGQIVGQGSIIGNTLKSIGF